MPLTDDHKEQLYSFFDAPENFRHLQDVANLGIKAYNSVLAIHYGTFITIDTIEKEIDAIQELAESNLEAYYDLNDYDFESSM